MNRVTSFLDVQILIFACLHEHLFFFSLTCLHPKAVGRCFRLGGPNAESARAVQVCPGACSPGKFLISVSETRFPTFWGQF